MTRPVDQLLAAFSVRDCGESRAADMIDHDRSARLRAAQIDAVMRFTPTAFVVNLINAALVSFVVGAFASPAWLALWNLGLLSVCGLGLRAWILRKLIGPRLKASARAIRRSLAQAAILAALWALVPIAWFPGADPTNQLVIGIVITGMICAGGFALATVRAAANAYVIVLSGGALAGIALSSTPHAMILSGLLAAYAIVVMRSVDQNSRLFKKQFLAEIELRERGETIELLLAEFEENASDWLFEIDTQGRLTKYSGRLASVTGRDIVELEGVALASLLSSTGASRLDQALSEDRPFRDLHVQAEGSQGPRHWSLTAGPIFDEASRKIGWRGVGSDITEAWIANSRISYLATTDTLTGLANRPQFLEAANAATVAARAAGRGVAIGCLDLDDFKQVNDRFGHPVGDLLLRDVAGRLKRWAGDEVLVSRLGGDEFGILFPSDMDLAMAMDLSGQAIAALSGPYNLDGQTNAISASIGMASSAIEPIGTDELMRRADFALYRAKQAGGGQACLYDPVMHREVEDEARLQEDLALAISRNELSLAYQPIVEVATGEVIGFEALLRWTHPQRGIVSPASFVPLAERSGLIVGIGAWVIETACAEAAHWPDTLSVSVNVSPAQIGKSDMIATVADVLARTGLPARRLELEITETVFMDYESKTLAFLTSMRGQGVSIALDDFGTGYSSLGYLGRFPIDKLKIDKAFVSGAGPLAKRTAIAQAVIGMARSLGMSTTAEGVEDDAILAWLRLSGCLYAQGYHFSKPMPASAIPAYLAANAKAAAEMLARRIASPYEPALKSA